MSSSGAHHVRSGSLMSYDDEPSTDAPPPPTRGRPPAHVQYYQQQQHHPTTDHHGTVLTRQGSYGYPTATTTAIKTSTRSVIPRNQLKKPPPGSRNSRSSLIEEDDDDDDDDDNYDNGTNGPASYRGNNGRTGSYGYTRTVGNGGHVPTYDDQDSKVSASSITWEGGDGGGGHATATAPNGMGRNTLPNIGYGMAFPVTDARAQRKERRTLMPDPVAPLEPKPSGPSHSHHKAPSPRTASATTRRSGVRRGPPLPSKNSNSSQPPVATVDVRQSLALWTAQFDQLDDETLLEEHATQTRLEIESATGKTLSGPNHGAETKGANGDEDDDEEDALRASLPRPSQGRKDASILLTQHMYKPLEPNTSTHRLRFPSTTPDERVADVVTGVQNASLTPTHQRIACIHCTVPLVVARSAVLIDCPRCHSGTFPNRRTTATSASSNGVKAPPPTAPAPPPLPPVRTEWSC